MSPTARPPVSTVDKTAQQDAITKPTVQTTELHIPHTYSRYTCMYYRSVLYAELYIRTYHWGIYTLLHTILYIHTIYTILYTYITY